MILRESFGVCFDMRFIFYEHFLSLATGLWVHISFLMNTLECTGGRMRLYLGGGGVVLAQRIG